MIFSVAIAWAGAGVALCRLGRRRDAESPAPVSLPFVSILIPARNEAHNLPPLLASLKTIDYPAFEIIVIDDNSTDGTAQAAQDFGVRVMTGAPLPPGWNGKNWACHQAAAGAKGEIFLFTDADTIHRPDGLRRAVAFLTNRNADLVSALPFHLSPTMWERMMGPFHSLLLVATAHRSPRRNRLYAIGQFLLFRRSFYERLGGHASVAALYPDDLALANRTLELGGRFAFHAGIPFFDVRMYGGFTDFVQGWRRNFAAGLRLGHWTGATEVTLVIAALLAGGNPGAGLITWLPALLVAALIALRQRSWGEFSLTGAVLYPFALSVYSFVSVLAVIDLLRGGTLRWKGRALADWAGPKAVS